jgi:hypothetical protein
MDESTLESCTYRLLPGTDRDAFLAANEPVERWLAAQPGYRGRQLTGDEDGAWHDLVWWADRSSAEAAAVAFMEAPEAVEMNGMLDPGSLVFRHLRVVRTSWVGAPAADAAPTPA